MITFIFKILQGDTMTKWAVACAKCASNDFKNEKKQYMVTGDVDNPHGEVIVMAECIDCGHVQCVV